MARSYRILIPVAVALVALPPWLAAQVPPRASTPTTPAAAPAGGSPAAGSGEPEIVIQNLQSRLLPIAVPAMRGDATAGQVTSVLSNDLRLSALFRVIEPERYTAANLAAEGLTINPAPWVQAGATAVVKAQVTGAGDAVRAELRLWEPGRPSAPVMSRTFGPGNARRVAHDIANEIIRQYTGRPGIFGTRILFARRTGRNRKDVFLVDSDGANLAQVSSGRRLNFLPAWGPGGIYYSMQTYEGFIALVRSARPAPVPVLQIEGMVMGASFGGGRMAVVLNRDGNSEIYSASPSGNDLRRLTNNGAADVSPVYSPDGSRIAFVSDREGSPQIYVMSASGGGARRVTHTGSYNQTPAWSPDGTTIAYSSRIGGNYDIFAVNVASGGVRRLTENQGSNSDPTYAPDGRLIAFSSSRGGIFLMNQDGLAQQQILAGGGETLRWER
jgi:TolB protein